MKPRRLVNPHLLALIVQATEDDRRTGDGSTMDFAIRVANLVYLFGLRRGAEAERRRQAKALRVEFGK